MSCAYCKPKNKENLSLNNDCVLFALDKIKGHYLSLKNEVHTKDNEIQKLLQRNAKLVKAVELLQKENVRSTFLSFSQQSPQKRRKTNAINQRRNSDFFQEATAGHCPAVLNADTIAEDLNMALNSEQILSCSSADSSTQLSPNHNESINETEKVNSPRVLRTSFQQRRELLKKRKLRMHQSNENLQSTVASVGGAKKTESGWMSKEKPVKSRSLDGENKVVGEVGSFVKPQMLHGGKMERKPSLSLKKPVKLRQTRLQLDVSREKSCSGSDSTFCEEVIEASPCTHASLKKEKPARSWMLRVSNDSKKNSSPKAVRSKQPTEESSTVEVYKDEDFGQVFDFTFDPPSPAPQQEPAVSISSAEDILFELADSSLKAPQSENKVESSSNSSSVMILTPASQEIIFVDDTFNYNTNIASMDLMQDMLKSADESLEHLKRIENEKIKKLQKTASAAPKLETTNDKKKLQLQPVSAASSKSMSLTTIPLSTNKPTNAGFKIKQEKITLKPADAISQKDSVERKSHENSSEEDEDFMPQPILVKLENLDTNASQEINNAKSKKLSIKEKFNIDCRDCQQYIDFLGDRMTDKEITEHLRRCTRHQLCEVDINPTPEGFWDPFIASFDVNDPRNETLIDSRFADRKK